MMLHENGHSGEPVAAVCQVPEGTSTRRIGSQAGLHKRDDVRWNPAALQGACISLPGDRLPAPPAQLSGKDA